MSDNFHDLHLIVRENTRATRKKARQNIMQAAVAGRGLDMADVARARGLVLREREHSIFSDAWVPLAVLFVLIGFFANRNSALMVLGFALLIIVWASTVWKNLALFGVTYERQFDRTRVFPGEPVSLTIKVENDKILPLTWLQFQDEMPVAIESELPISQAAVELTGKYILQNTYSLYGRESSQRTVTLRFPKRGYYNLGPVTYESGDIFTLFTVERQHAYIDHIVVYPQIYPLEALNLPPKEPFGDIRVHRSLFTDPIKTQGIRDYQMGDRFRDIHWKASARNGRLQTKVYDPSVGMTVAVFLNVTTMAKHWLGFEPEKLERAISVAGSICNHGLLQGWGVGVYANGSVPGSDQPIRVPPSRSPDQLSAILEALAAVTEFATGSIERMLFRESPLLSWSGTIVLVTAVVTENMIVVLTRLKEAGRRVVLLSLADAPPPKGLGNIITYHIPANVPAFQKERKSSTLTEAALNAIPPPKPISAHDPILVEDV